MCIEDLLAVQIKNVWSTDGKQIRYFYECASFFLFFGKQMDTHIFKKFIKK